MSTSHPTFNARPDTIADWIIQVLRLVDQVAVSLGIRYILAGAKARELIQESVFGLARWALSEDLDVGFAVKDWQEFTRLKSALLATGKFESSDRQLQRLFYRDAEGLRRFVDLIPFGGVADERGTIAWPPSKDTVLNVAGFEEALDSSILVQLADDLCIPVVSLAGLAMLKLIAWEDRGEGNNKDAVDLYYLLTKHADAGNADRLYGDEITLLEKANYDFELAGALLLGKDVATISRPDTAARIMNLLQSEKQVKRLGVQMLQATTVFDEQDQARCAQILETFRGSFLSHASGSGGPQNE